MIIQHFDSFSGRFIDLEVSDEQVALKRAEAENQTRAALSREACLRRCQRLHDNGASLEHVLGLAFNTGHGIGSKSADLTELDLAVLDSLDEIDNDELSRLTSRSPGFVAAVSALRKNVRDVW